jgi:hypothetical protein
MILVQIVGLRAPFVRPPGDKPYTRSSRMLARMEYKDMFTACAKYSAFPGADPSGGAVVLQPTSQTPSFTATRTTVELCNIRPPNKLHTGIPQLRLPSFSM